MSMASCQRTAPLPPDTEAVLSDGMKIAVITPSGKLEIEGKAGALRAYSGEDWSRTATLIPRKDRWAGSHGLYDPASSATLGDRLLIEEGRQYFSSESEAQRYMQRLKGYYGTLTYNSSGLVVAYKIIDIENEKPTRSLEVWQFYINGKRPTALRGAVDRNIEVSGGTIPDQSTPAPVPEGYERELADSEYSSR